MPLQRLPQFRSSASKDRTDARRFDADRPRDLVVIGVGVVAKDDGRTLLDRKRLQCAPHVDGGLVVFGRGLVQPRQEPRPQLPPSDARDGATRDRGAQPRSGIADLVPESWFPDGTFERVLDAVLRVEITGDERRSPVQRLTVLGVKPIPALIQVLLLSRI